MARKRKISIAGRKVTVVPMSAKEGLKAVISLADILKQAVPYLVMLTEKSRRRRITAMAVMLTEIEGLDEVAIDLVARGTGLSKKVVEDEATAAEFLDALTAIVKVNKWNELWRAAYSLRIVEQTSLVDLAVAQFGKLRTR